MDLKLPTAVKTIFNKLEEAGHEVYLVGGSVRDILRGVKPHDYDLATSALPEEIKAVFPDFKTLLTGEKHGTVTVIIEKKSFEITTFRTESSYSDGRHPDSVNFSKNVKDDLRRRDFTMNAIAMKQNGDIIDLSGGKSDIEKGIIRTVGKPARRFSEDALRILRALRFASAFGFKIEDKTKKALFELKGLVKNLSGERIYTEFVGILCGKYAESVLLEYYEVIGEFIPEILPTVGFEQHNPYHIYDVYTHIVKTVACIEPNPVLRLTMFFHDIAKPLCFALDSYGLGHFSGHTRMGASIAGEVLKRLKADGRTCNTVTTLVLNHDVYISNEKSSLKRMALRLGVEKMFLLFRVMRADNSCKNPRDLTRYKHSAALEKTFSEIIDKGECFTVAALKVTGNDMKALGFSGEEIGLALHSLLNDVIDEVLKNSRPSLLEQAKTLASDKSLLYNSAT